MMLRFLSLIFFFVTTHLCVAQRTQSAVRIAKSVDLTDSLLLVEVIDTAAFENWCRTGHEFACSKISGNVYRVQSTHRKYFKELATCGFISTIDRWPRQPKVETILGEFDNSASGVSSAHFNFPDANGTGVTLSVKEEPFDENDIDLLGRVVLGTQGTTESLHATIMATIAAGAGNSTPRAKGVAFGSNISTSSFDVLLPDNGQELTALGVTVQNHSYGVGVENYYGIESKAYDLAVKDFPTILHVFSSGNEGLSNAPDGRYSGINGFANLTGQFKTAKNVLTVGSVDATGTLASRSSRGPTYDGRVKPELVAYGDAGSSESAALVSGAALLIQDVIKSNTGVLPDAALVKCILINSAVDVGRKGVDFENGFGNLDVNRALKIASKETYFTGEIASLSEKSYEVIIPEEAVELKITLSWLDQPAEPFNDEALINDLNLRLIAPDGSMSFPLVLDSTPSTSALSSEAVQGNDSVNNIEQIVIANPLPGTYTIQVSSQALVNGPQKFHVAYDFGVDFEWYYPLAKDVLIVGEETLIRWRSDMDAQGDLYYRSDENDNWELLASNLDLREGQFQWQTQSSPGRVTFQMRVDGDNYNSDPVYLTDEHDIEVNFDCSEEFMISWDRSELASSYTVYRLGSKYLESVVTTTDTFAILSKETVNSLFVSIAANFDGVTERKSTSVNYSTQGVGCYIISFLPRSTVTTSDVTFDLYLGTTYNLSSVTLERKRGDEFQNVYSYDSDLALNLMFQDSNPTSDLNIYRVKLTTQDGRTFFSNEESVLFVGRDQVYLFPNPVSRGNEVNLIIDDENYVDILIHDTRGQFIASSNDFGVSKSFDTSKMNAGIYFVKVKREDGTVVTGKLVIK